MDAWSRVAQFHECAYRSGNAYRQFSSLLGTLQAAPVTAVCSGFPRQNPHLLEQLYSPGVVSNRTGKRLCRTCEQCMRAQGGPHF